MSLVLIAVLIASHHECVSSYKPLVPRFLGSKLESFQSQLSKAGKALGSIVIASTLLNIPMNVEQVNAVDRYNNKLNAPTASGTRVNSDAESLLRYGKTQNFIYSSIMLSNLSAVLFLLLIS
jgi:hypothetical protein